MTSVKAHASYHSVNGVDVSEIIRMGENRPDFEGDELDFIGFIYFSGPDGNEGLCSKSRADLIWRVRHRNGSLLRR